MKTNNDYFLDWEAHVFGFGYGTGEEHVLPALKCFMERVPKEGAYDYRELEKILTPLVAWLFINALCKADIIEYGSSPRFAWLTPQGRALQEFLESKTEAELVALSCSASNDYVHCYPDYCNCDGERCHNPFWVERSPPLSPEPK